MPGRVREWDMHVPQWELVRLRLPDAPLSRDVRAEQQLLGHVRERAMRLSDREQLHVHMFGIALPHELCRRRSLCGPLPGGAGRH